MRILALLLLTLPIFIGCSKNDGDGIDCALYDPAFPTLFVRVVDANGTNLIENGTINPEDITVEGDFAGAGFQFVPPNEFADPDADIRQFDNSIQLFIPNVSTFKYTINFGDADTIIVDFSAEQTKLPCDLSYFKPINGVISNQPLELRTISPLQFLAIIVL